MPEFIVASSVPPLYSLYPATEPPPLSVEALQPRFTWAALITLAVKFWGTEGAEVSSVVTLTGGEDFADSFIGTASSIADTV